MPAKPTNEVTEEDFDKVFNVNVKAIYYSCNVIVPYMQKKGNGGSFVSSDSHLICETQADTLRFRAGLDCIDGWYPTTTWSDVVQRVEGRRHQCNEVDGRRVRQRQHPLQLRLPGRWPEYRLVGLVGAPKDDDAVLTARLDRIYSWASRRTRKHFWPLCLLDEARLPRTLPMHAPSSAAKRATF